MANRGRSQWEVVVAMGAIVALSVWFSTWTGDSASLNSLRTSAANFVIVLATSLPLALVWLGAAWGFGRGAIRLLRIHGTTPDVVHLGLGVGLMLFASSALGSIGLLQVGGGAGAWALIAIGAVIALATYGQERNEDKSVEASPGERRDSWAWATLFASPAVAVLAVAACAAPGWLWASEFGGYDALSYHLQLPKEWINAGQIIPLDHNAYSHLPSYVEGAFYHLMVLRGDAVAASYACQLLHAAVAVLTAVTVADTVRRLTESPAGSWVATACVLGTPWVVVVGSLAYSEMFVGLFFACALSMIFINGTLNWRENLIIVIFVAAAVASKLTAAGMVALPVGILVLLRVRARAWGSLALIAVVAGAIYLSPYLLRNAISTGNPVFPFATSVFGDGHWTHEQVADWRTEHGPPPWSDRPSITFDQLLAYGMGSSPVDGEPWKPQWSILFWLMLASMVLGLLDRSQRRIVCELIVVVALMLSFWVFATHMKSRFMVPAVVPAAILIAVSITPYLARRPHRLAIDVAIGIIALLWCIQPAMIYHSERTLEDGSSAASARIGWGAYFSGDGFSPNDRAQAAQYSRAIYLNHFMPRGSRTLLVGDATPFYIEAGYGYATVWDRTPFERAMETSDDPASWFAAARAAGYDHLLIDAGMIARLWTPRRPDVDARAIVAAADRYGELIHVFDERLAVRLYRIRE